MSTVTLYYNVVTPRFHEAVKDLRSHGTIVHTVDTRRRFMSYNDFIMILQRIDSFETILRKSPEVDEWFASEETQNMTLLELYAYLRSNPTWMRPYIFCSQGKVLVGIHMTQVSTFYPRERRIQRLLEQANRVEELV